MLSHKHGIPEKRFCDSDPQRRRQNILASLCLIPCLCLISQGAVANELPTISLEGFIDFQMAHSHHHPADLRTTRSFKGQSDTELQMDIRGTSAYGFHYGARIDLEADVGYDEEGGLNAHRTWLYLETPAGLIEAGSTRGASKTLKIDASTLARATGGIDGDWVDYVDARLDNAYPQIISPDLPLEHRIWLSGANDENSNKITYYTPVWYGLQGGISYIPDSEVKGTATSFPDDGLSFLDALTAGIQYRFTADPFSSAFAVTLERGRSDDGYSRDLAAWNTGAMVTYGSFSLAGSYGNWGRSGDGSSSDEVDVREYWTAGIGYTSERWGTSLTYLRSWGGKSDQGADSLTNNVNNRFDNLVTSVDYLLAPGLSLYTEFSVFDLRQHFWKDRHPEVVHGNNHGNVFIIGTLLSF